MNGEQVTLTVLIENTVTRAPYTAEHGLSMLVRRGDDTILWDTGQSGRFLNNAAHLDIDIDSIDSVALSHGHYDHTGGLSLLLERRPGLTVHCHPGVFTGRYIRRTDGGAVSVGMQFGRAVLESAGARFALHDGPAEIATGIMLTGPIPRVTDYEDTGGAFFVDEACTEPDDLTDDQSLVVATEKGPAVILGCCHAGIVNTLTRVAELTGTGDFALVAGGMHLLNASPERMERTIEALGGFTIRALAPGHCTGLGPVCELARAFPEAFMQFTTGMRWEA